MDFMKVFDQTVRDIKREVNLKVLKVPEIEQKVLDATDDEPWGPHGTALAEIAQATKKFSECQIVMNVLWARLTETGKNWRFVYKALAVIEYLVAHGSERAVDDVVEHTFQISSLASFEYVEPNGKDLGINVRKKAETIVSLLNNKEKIQETRNKAAGNRDKYVGLSSSGVTFKSGTASFTSSSFQSGDKYGGFGSENDSDEYGNNSKEKDLFAEDKFKSRRDNSSDLGKTTRKKSSHSNSKSQETKSAAAVKKPTKISETINSQSSSTPKGNDDDNFDDFDPRGTFNAKPSAESSNQVDLFGDFLDAPIPVSEKNSTPKGDSSDVDLFADAAFVSATSQVGGSSAVQVDLFASQPAPSSTTSLPMDFFAKPDHATQSDHLTAKSQPSTADNLVDPFAAIPMNNFDNSDPFGDFAQNPANDSHHTNSNGSKNVGSTPSSQIKLSGSSGDNNIPPSRKDGFQVKSGIWADSLSRGLIDLNITAPKKVNLADVGIAGGLVDDPFGKNNMGASSHAFNMGTSMNNTGPNLGHSGFSSATSGADDFFSSLSNQQSYQYAAFKK